MSAKTWNSYSFSINGFPVQARFAQEDIHGLFVPLLRRLALLQRKKENGLSYSWPRPRCRKIHIGGLPLPLVPGASGLPAHAGVGS